MPILESVTYIAKWNNGMQEVYLYYEYSYLELKSKFKIKYLDNKTKEIFTKEKFRQIYEWPICKEWQKYSKEMQD